MSFHFCFGPSGAGKSHYLIHEITHRAEKSLHDSFTQNGRKSRAASDLATNYLYIVPEQFTMQTQKDLVLASSSHGIMNVDVLSFGRLGHRIFEEVGADTRTVLDDVGKSLAIQRAASSILPELKVIGGQMSRPGMVAEVKSMLSEFMQYDIDPAGVRTLADYAASHGQNALALKLCDLGTLYDAFLNFKRDHFLTGEETMTLLAEAIPQSRLIRHSVLVFDGFTGFTPVQYAVLEALLQYAPEVIFAITIAEDDGPTPAECEILPTRENIRKGVVPVFEEQDLFCLSRQTIRKICVHAERVGAVHEEDIYLGQQYGEHSLLTANGKSQAPSSVFRFRNNPSLAFLERHLFRYPLESYGNRSDKAPAVELFTASGVREEVRQIAIRMEELIRTEGYAYRDFAVVCGDLDGYAEEIAQAAQLYHIPVYIDRTRAIRQNPLTEAISSALEIADNDYSYATVFRYLRSGLTGISSDAVDRLENYCLAHGITSRKKWSLPFDDDVEEARLSFLAEMAPLEEGRRGNAQQRTLALYHFLEGLHAEERMQAYAEDFRNAGDPEKQQEYEQCYGAVCHLLDQIYTLLGEEKISADDYQDLIKAGFEEIRLGTLPQQVDRVLVGDMERTRLGQVRVLFLCGVNDGNIPKNSSKGGLISDLDREFLDDSGIELAPTPREQMYIQHLYLYLMLTKETDRLILSCARMALDGSSLRPSYLFSLLQRMYPDLAVSVPENRPILDQLVAPEDAKSFLAGALRDYAAGTGDGSFLPVFSWAIQPVRPAGYRRDILRLQKAAFARYSPHRISPETARALYGRSLYGSVSRLENAVQCYLRQFLRYGLRLQPREEYTLEPADSGTILHEGICRFSGLLQKRGVRWRDADETLTKELVHQAVEEEAADYRNHLLLGSSRSQYGAQRAERILERTVNTLQFQLQQGSFEPLAYEQSFGENDELRFALPDGGEMILHGRIDRVDLAEADGCCWLKIIDYKSGSLDLDRDQILHGLRLQLILYMNAEIAMQKGLRPGDQVEPAALLYYRFQDPVLGPDQTPDTPEEIRNALRRTMRPRGLVNDDAKAISLLDHSGVPNSLVIPVSHTKSGALSRTSKTFSGEEFAELSKAVEEIIVRVASNILEGNIAADPAMLQGGRTACSFCPYANVCGFDPRIPGYHYWRADPLGLDRRDGKDR